MDVCIPKHLRSLFSLLTVLCYVYYISFLPRLMGRQGTMYSAKPGNGHTLGRTGIHTLGHMIRVCEEVRGGRQSCRHAAIHT